MAAPRAESAPLLWRRTGRVAAADDGGLPFAGATQALSECGEARPCIAERWVREDLPAEGMLILRSGDHIEVPGRALRWRTSWRAVSGPLPGCLGSLLADPPGGDPTGVRHLEQQGDSWTWVLSLGGHNRCGLSGELRLSVDEDRADADGLLCGGALWLSGGSVCATTALRGWARAHVTATWDQLSLTDRAEWLAILGQDPDAADLVAELRARP